MKKILLSIVALCCTIVAGAQSTDEISAIKDSLQVGDTLTLSIWRDGETMDITITLVDTNDVYS